MVNPITTRVASLVIEIRCEGCAGSVKIIRARLRQCGCSPHGYIVGLTALFADYDDLSEAIPKATCVYQRREPHALSLGIECVSHTLNRDGMAGFA